MKPGKRTLKHKRACYLYAMDMLDEYGYVFCESKYCKAQNKPPHSVHHIMSAGRWPAHEFLHDKRNLIMLCCTCHNEFEQHKRKKEHNELVADRELDKLFRRTK